MFTHEGQGRGSVSHGVCAVEDHKTIVVFIVFLDKKNIMRIILDGSMNTMLFFLPFYMLYFMSSMNLIGLIDA